MALIGTVNANIIGVGGATPSSSGSGITFPASQSASTDANTLDDYEEGTYTPTVTPTSGAITSYTSTGYYVKTGKQVTCWFNVKITNVGTGTGTATIASLPFSHNATDQYGIVALGRDTDVTGYVFQGWGSGTSFTVQTVTNGDLMATNTRYVGFVTYTF